MSNKARFGIVIEEAPGSSHSVDQLVSSAFRANEAGRHREAAELCRKVLRTRPKHYLALQILGVAAFKCGAVEESLQCFEKAVVVEPQVADGFNNLGNVLVELGRFDAAAANLAKAVELNPNSADAFNNLGRAYAEMGRYDEAVAATQSAIERNPGLAEAYINLGKLLMDVGLTEEGLPVFAKALEIDPRRADAHGNFLMCLQYSPSNTAKELFGAARQWAAAHAPPSLIMPAAPSYGHEKLRIGYVSGDLRAHPVGYTMEKLFPAHDRDRFDVYAYSNCRTDDAISERLKAAVGCWRNVSGLDDDSAARLIRQDEIDVLIDLSGHSALNRLGVFARKPAPVQATWMGYFATTGMPQMDYILRDRAQIPMEEEPYYVEKLALLPDDLYCFAPPHEDATVSPSPCLENGYVTFGSFNNLSKVNDRVVALWSRVLNSVPGSKMLLDRRPLSGQIARLVLTEAFAKHGIGPERLVFAASQGRTAYLRAYAGVDVVLDTFPFNGATTTYESLWMGVPVLTRTWDRMVGHFGEAILRGAGRPEWIARSDDEFVARAVAIAEDPQALETVRRGLRDEFLACPLCDGKPFAKLFEEALIRLWEARS
jgi:protein O-GlcNAc transferase